VCRTTCSDDPLNQRFPESYKQFATYDFKCPTVNGIDRMTGVDLNLFKGIVVIGEVVMGEFE
jgi:hypothetical protein